MLDAFDEQISDELRDWIRDLLNDRVGERCLSLIDIWLSVRKTCLCMFIFYTLHSKSEFALKNQSDLIYISSERQKKKHLKKSSRLNVQIKWYRRPDVCIPVVTIILCMPVYQCECMHAYLFMCLSMCWYTFLLMWMCVHMNVFACLSVWICVCETYLYDCIFIYVLCLSVWMCVWFSLCCVLVFICVNMHVCAFIHVFVLCELFL